MSRIARDNPDRDDQWTAPRLVAEWHYVPRRRCYCGRSVSWDGVFCAEHDDGPEPKESA